MEVGCGTADEGGSGEGMLPCQLWPDMRLDVGTLENQPTQRWVSEAGGKLGSHGESWYHRPIAK